MTSTECQLEAIAWELLTHGAFVPGVPTTTTTTTTWHYQWRGALRRHTDGFGPAEARRTPACPLLEEPRTGGATKVVGNDCSLPRRPTVTSVLVSPYSAPTRDADDRAGGRSSATGKGADRLPAAHPCAASGSVLVAGATTTAPARCGCRRWSSWAGYLPVMSRNTWRTSGRGCDPSVAARLIESSLVIVGFAGAGNGIDVGACRLMPPR